MIETKFKPTEIGLIPEDWGCIKFGETIKFISNNTLSRDFLCDDGAIKNIHYGDVLIKYGSVLDVRNSQIPAVNEALTTFKLRNVAQDGDIIIADTAEDETVCKATELYNIGDCKVVSGLHTMWCRPQDGLFAGKYLGYFFNASIYHNQVLPYIQGIKVSSVSKCAIQDTFILVPNYSEQQRIASALTSVDNLLSSLDKLIAKKRDIKQGAMQQLLTGKTRLKGFTEPWCTKILGEYSKIYRGGSPRPIEAYLTDSADGVNWIKIGDVKAGSKYINKTNERIKPSGVPMSRKVYVGDFILSNSMSFGRPYILNIDGCIHDGWLVIQDYQETFDKDFLYYALGSDDVFKQYISMAAGSSVKNLNKDKVANVVLSVPNTKSEQQAIASVLSSMDTEIVALEAKRKKYEAVKQGMMQQLLTGKIRLI
jgi:type I restriction enzyme S subunit